MTDFVALYRGNQAEDAKLIAVTADPEIVGVISHALSEAAPTETDGEEADGQRPVLSVIRGGRDG